MFLRLFKNFILVLLLTAFLFNGAYLFNKPKIALATIPVVDVDGLVQLTAMNTTLGTIEGTLAAIEGTEAAIEGTSAATEVSTTGHWVDIIAQWALKIGGQLIKKQILDRLVDELINWINRDGRGAIVDDWGEFLSQAGQSAVGEFAQELGLGFLCSPFHLQVRLALLPVRTFSEQAGCTLSTIQGNIDQFFEDFQNGGWIAYQEHWQPQNNFFGATLMGLDEHFQRQAAGEAAAQNEAQAGGGFLSFKRCDENGRNCRITTPGGIAAEATKQALVDIPANSIINADDVAEYISEIIDAVVTRLSNAAMEGLQGLGRTEDELATAEEELETATQAQQTTSESVLQNSKNFYLDTIERVSTTWQNADARFNSAYSTQNRLIAEIEELIACNPSSEQIQGLLTPPQENLQDLLAAEKDEFEQIQQDKDDTAEIIELLETAYQNVNNASDEQALNSAFAPIQAYTASDAQTVLANVRTLETNARDQLNNIQDKIDEVCPL